MMLCGTVTTPGKLFPPQNIKVTEKIVKQHDIYSKVFDIYSKVMSLESKEITRQQWLTASPAPPSSNQHFTWGEIFCYPLLIQIKTHGKQHDI